MTKGNLDLTSGNVYKTLLSFTLPFMIANFIQALYGAVDMAVVGWFSSSASIAAVSIGTQIMQMFTSLIAIVCVVNIAMDMLLVGGLGMGAAGASLATVASQRISFILSVIYLRKRDFVFDFRLKSFKIHQDKMKKLFKLGIPVSLQETTVSLSFLL